MSPRVAVPRGGRGGRLATAGMMSLLVGLLLSIAHPARAAVPSTRLDIRAPISAGLNDPFTAIASLSGQDPTGSITFWIYGPNDPTCAGPEADFSLVAVGGNGDYESKPVAFSAAGAYRWVATYSGDANDPGVKTACSADAETEIQGGILVQVLKVGAPESSGDKQAPMSLVDGLLGSVGLGSLATPSGDSSGQTLGITIPTTPMASASSTAATAPAQTPPTTISARASTTSAAVTTTTTAVTTTTVAVSVVPVPPPLPPPTTVTVPPTTVPVVEDADGLSIAAVGTAVAALALAAGALLLVLLLRRRRPAVLVGYRSREPRHHGEVADDIFGTAPGVDLAHAGPASARVVAACGGDARVASPLIATLAWEAFVSDPGFVRLLRRMGVAKRAVRRSDIVVVRHAGETRHDLLVFDRGFKGAMPVASAVDLRSSASTCARRRHRLSWDTLLRSSVRPWASLDEATLVGAIQEAAATGRFGLAVARAPKVLMTNVPSPAMSVATAAGGPVATAGAIVAAGDGTLAVTTVLHAVKGHSSVSVDGRLGQVVSVHEPTDSCLIAVPDLALDSGVLGRAGPLQGVSPRQYGSASFEGIASGARDTTVTSWDLSILTRQQFMGSKVYTKPDTVPGDSGAALIDDDDYILGFAVFRSGFGEPIEYSAWVWADQVFGANTARMVGSAHVSA